MPFPLAHPAAVLPFRRLCPVALSLPALMIGSVAPDMGYVFGMGHLSHRLIGIPLFSMPVGAAMLLVLYFAGFCIAPMMPQPFSRIVAPLLHRRAGMIAIIASLAIGAATHVLWDSVTHKEGWIVVHMAVLRSPLVPFGHRWIRICHLLWYGSTFAGVLWLGIAYQQWREEANPGGARASLEAKAARALLFATLALPIAVAHHIGRRFIGDAGIAALSACLVAAFAFWIERKSAVSPASLPKGPS